MRVVLLGAGGPAGVNVARSLYMAGHEVIGLDTNGWHLPWAEPYCAHTAICPPWDDLASYVLDLQPDLVHSQPEQGLPWLASRPEIPSFIPSARTIERTQDKTRAAALWAQAGLRAHNPVPVTEPYPDHLNLAKDLYGLPFWLRASRGAGARGATLVNDLRTAFHWIRYWETRGTNIEWLAEEYLPGRDYCWSSLWCNGHLVSSFSRERLEWIYPHLAPSGRTGTPAIAVTVHDERVSGAARAAVEVVDEKPHGLYCVDLREDAGGTPRPTEINAGRFATTTPLYASLGYNMADHYVRIGCGDDTDIIYPNEDPYPAGAVLLRHIDCGYTFRPAEKLAGVRPGA